MKFVTGTKDVRLARAVVGALLCVGAMSCKSSATEPSDTSLIVGPISEAQLTSRSSGRAIQIWNFSGINRRFLSAAGRTDSVTVVYDKTTFSTLKFSVNATTGERLVFASGSDTMPKIFPETGNWSLGGAGTTLSVSRRPGSPAGGAGGTWSLGYVETPLSPYSSASLTLWTEQPGISGGRIRQEISFFADPSTLVTR